MPKPKSSKRPAKAKKAPPPKPATSRARERSKPSGGRRAARIFARILARPDAPPPPPPPGPESTVAQRVEYCWLLMSQGLWRNYATRVELAAAWGVQDTTIRDYSAEASRRLRLEPEEVEAAKVRHARNCEEVRTQALTTFNEITGLPDFSSALKATELAAKFEGVEIDKTKVELTGKDGGPIETRSPVIMVPPEIEE